VLAPSAVAVIVVALSVLGVAALAWHVWYAAGFARVLAAHDVPTWRAWIPLVNEAELFRLGRVEPVKAVLFLVPFVAVYALVLKIVAAHRVGASYGRGAGTTTLAVLLPPVWSGVLASSRRTVADADADDEDGPVVLVASAPAPAAGTLIADPAPVTAAPGPIAPPPGPGAISPSVFAPSAPATPITAAPVPGQPIVAAPSVAPVAAPAPAPAPAAAPAPAPAPTAAPVAPAPDAPGPRRTRRGAEPVIDAAPVNAAAPAAAAAPAEVEERTQLSRGPRAWELVLPTGEVVPIVSRTVVLGRKPGTGDENVQAVTVVDESRTVSKQHARLTWAGDGWTLTDLGSTNGAALLAPDGAEQRLASGASAPARGAFALGDARLQLRLARR